MNFMNYHKAILFDLDGVILDTEKLYLNLMLKYNKKLNLSLSPDFYKNNILGKSQNEISKILENEWREEYNSKKYWNGLLEYRKNYLNKHSVNVKKGFNELFKYLKNNNYYLGIVTSNSFSLTKLLLNKARISINDFDIIITREDVDKLKPHPDLYELAVKKLNIDKHNAIAIEDSMIGINAALHANINVINIQDIAIVDKTLKSKCLFVGTTLYDVIGFIEKHGGKYGNNKNAKI